MQSTHEMNNSYQQLKEIVDPCSLGRVISAGFNSVVIKPYNEYQEDGLNIKNPVLIITLESQKYEFMRKLVGRKCKKVNLKKIDSMDYCRQILEVIKDHGFTIFYMERFEEPKMFFNPSAQLTKVFRKFAERFRDSYSRYDLDYFYDEIKFLFQQYNCKEKEVLRAIKQSFNALKKTSIDDNFSVDLHEKQFLSCNGKIICVDPVLFNFKELQGQLMKWN